MKINQLFKAIVPEGILIKILANFGYEGLDEHEFCRADLEQLHTVEKMNALRDELSKYYLPCKSNMYLNDLDVKKTITIFRQILRLNGRVLVSKQKYVKQTKTTFYHIAEKNLENTHITHQVKIDNEKTIVTF